MNITLNDFQVFLAVTFVLLGGIATVGKAIDVIKGWRKPSKTQEERLSVCEAKLDTEHKRLENLEEGNRALCRGVLALLNHELHNGNTEEMEKAQNGINNYLIER